MRWQCPDCEASVGKTEYRRASELQWVITPEGSHAGASDESRSSQRSGADSRRSEEKAKEESTSLLDNVQRVQDSILGEEDSSLQEQVESLSPGSDGSEDEK